MMPAQRPQGITPSINSGLIDLVVMVVGNPIAFKYYKFDLTLLIKNKITWR